MHQRLAHDVSAERVIEEDDRNIVRNQEVRRICLNDLDVSPACSQRRDVLFGKARELR